AAPPTAEAPAAAPAAELPSNEGPAAAPVAERPAAAPVEQQAARPKAEKPSEAKGSAEKRRDPESGRVLTYAQLVAMNQGRYSEAEIEQWWAQNCVPVEENDHASDNHRAVLPRLARQGVRGGGFRKAAAGTRSRAVGRRFALLATMLDDMARCRLPEVSLPRPPTSRCVQYQRLPPERRPAGAASKPIWPPSVRSAECGCEQRRRRHSPDATRGRARSSLQRTVPVRGVPRCVEAFLLRARPRAGAAGGVSPHGTVCGSGRAGRGGGPHGYALAGAADGACRRARAA
ncbi:unnamed protein product, partial [Prorocentrum cordatum]